MCIGVLAAHSVSDCLHYIGVFIQIAFKRFSSCRLKMVLTRTDLDEIRRIITEQVSSIFNDQFKNKLAESVMKKIDERYEEKFEKCNEEIDKINKNLCTIQSENKHVQKTLDNQEQFSRNRNIRIFGMPVNDSENLQESVLDLFKGKMELDIVPADIKNIHRVIAKNPTNKPPAVLVEFREVNKRSAVLKQRKHLKSSGIVIKEDLTQRRLMIFSEAVKKFTAKNVWCMHGNIFVKNRDIVHRISDEDDIIRISN